MTKKVGLIAIALIVVGAPSGGAWLACRTPQTMQITLRFHAFVGEEVLQLNQVRYSNPGGDGSFKVRDFQFFVSNIRLLADSAEFVVPESYHLARFDDEDGIYDLVINDVPPAAYGHIELGIGVDPAANGSIDAVGDLDPNGRMAWSWDIGYKFVLLEGGLVIGDTQFPLVYHVGFDENYREVSIDLDGSLLASHAPTLEFRADLLRMFNGAEAVDLGALPKVIFDRTDATLLADNYASMLSLCQPGCGQ